MEVRQLIVTRIIIITLIITCLLSCEDNTSSMESNETKHTEEIIVCLIDQFTKPIPPPPKSLESNEAPITETSPKIFSVGLNLVMQPIRSEYSSKIKEILKNVDTTFKINYDQDKKLEIRLERLNKNGKYTTRYINDDEKKVFNTIDILYNFSTINFSQDFTKAVLIIEMSRGKLNGFVDILVLEKIKGKWQIIRRKNLLIS